MEYCIEEESRVSDVVIVKPGMVVDFGTARRERQQELTWTSEEGVTLSHPPAGPPVLTWYGNVGDRFALAELRAEMSTMNGNICKIMGALDIQQEERPHRQRRSTDVGGGPW